MTNIAQTLPGEWRLIRERGRIGSAGEHGMVGCRKTEEEAEAALDKLPAQKCRRGYHQRETHRIT